MTIIESLRDARMLGALPKFADLSTWKAWLVFLCAIYGLPFGDLHGLVTEDEALTIFCACTGRTRYAPPPSGYAVPVAIVGRQAGKDAIAATIVAHEAVSAAPSPDGTERYALLLAQDQRSSVRTIFSTTVAPFDRVAAFKAMVPSDWRAMWRKARRADSLRLSNDVVVAAYPCRPSSVRGVRAVVAVLNEFDFYRSADGHSTATDMVAAVRPTLATTGGKLVILSSPYFADGPLANLHQKYFGRDDSDDVLVWQASAPTMNPTLPADYLRRMEQDDPEAYRSEVLGEFRAGVSVFFDAAALDACVDRGVRERMPVAGVRYAAGFDASGGRSDAAALSIARLEGSTPVEVVARVWPAPHNPAGVIAEACDELRRFGLTDVRGDKYAGEFVAEQFRLHGIRYVPLEQDRSQLYLALLPLVTAGQVRLLDTPETLRELRGLERRRSSAGRDRVDHRAGAHDDRANALAAAIVTLGPGRRCVSPLCSDPACQGRAGQMLLFGEEARRWEAAHPSLAAQQERRELEAQADAAIAAEAVDPAPVIDVMEAAAAGFSRLAHYLTARRPERGHALTRSREDRIAALYREKRRQEDIEADHAEREQSAQFVREQITRNGGAWFPGD